MIERVCVTERVHSHMYLCVTLKCVFVGTDNCNSALSGDVIWFVTCIILSAGNLASQENLISSVYAVMEAKI